jgi:hypothetical protein
MKCSEVNQWWWFFVLYVLCIIYVVVYFVVHQGEVMLPIDFIQSMNFTLRNVTV